MSGTTESTYPLVLVFYVDRQVMSNRPLMDQFSQSVNHLIEAKNFKVMAFFLPTDDVERIECINPIIAPPEQMERVNKLINDISVNFGIDGEKLELD
jgi:hypothetical protein